MAPRDGPRRLPAGARFGQRQQELLTALGMVLAAMVIAAVAAGAEPFTGQGVGPGYDARAYWEAGSGEPYRAARVGDLGAYLYSPAFAQLMSALALLPWDMFLVGWLLLLLAALLVLVGPLLFAPLLLLSLPELWGGNVSLLLALAVVIGLRWPAAWAFVLLTKVTPAIGLLWFVVRHEWRALGEALATTLLVVGVSAALAPDLWREWLEILLLNAGASRTEADLPVPLVLRLPVAAVLVAYAARTDRQWMVPVAATIAMPILWWGSFSVLVGVVALRRQEFEQALLRGLSAVRQRPTPPGDFPGSAPHGK